VGRRGQVDYGALSIEAQAGVAIYGVGQQLISLHPEQWAVEVESYPRMG
jgi:hypothetical protein